MAGWEKAGVIMQKSGSTKYVKAVLNLLTAVVLLLLVIFVLPRLLGFFMPFVVGWIIAMIANPLVRFFEQKIKIRRKAGSAIVIVAVLALVVCLGYLVIARLISEGAGFIADLPDIWKGLERDLNQVGANLTDFYARFPLEIRENLSVISEKLVQYIGDAINGLSAPTVTAVGNFAKNIPSILIGTIMCLLSSYFFVAEKDNVGKFLRKYLPESFREKWKVLSTSLAGAVGGYFKAQCKIEIWIYLILMIGLWILKVDYALLIALLIAVLDFLPIFGTGAVLWPWAVIELLAGDYRMALSLMIIWGVAQLLRQIIQPKIVGDSIGMPPIPTLFLLFIGYKVGSVVGIILAVPIGIVVVNMYEAGLFETTMDSIRILIRGFNRFRKLNKEDLEELK
ncbi:sporulation integral membrane protein YtvI [Eisenbergiella tayi]|nr:sporulation integral membrane protein YtvI [Eisenbergiella tayi]